MTMICSHLMRNYKYLEKTRVNRAEKLEKIEEELKMFDPTGKITLTYTPLNFNDEIYHFQDLLYNEFWHTRMGEMAIVQLPSLEKCANFIKNLVEHPEEVSSDKHVNIYQMIDALDVKFSDRIWKTLYNIHANGIEELLWSQNHFPQFLPELLNIVNAIVSECNFTKNLVINPNLIHSFEADAHLFLSRMYATDSISMKHLME